MALTYLVVVKLAWHPLVVPVTYLELSSETVTFESALVRRNESRCFRESENQSTSLLDTICNEVIVVRIIQKLQLEQ